MQHKERIKYYDDTRPVIRALAIKKGIPPEIYQCLTIHHLSYVPNKPTVASLNVSDFPDRGMADQLQEYLKNEGLDYEVKIYPPQPQCDMPEEVWDDMIAFYKSLKRKWPRRSFCRS